jgi:hypothetical protein
MLQSRAIRLIRFAGLAQALSQVPNRRNSRPFSSRGSPYNSKATDPLRTTLDMRSHAEITDL